MSNAAIVIIAAVLLLGGPVVWRLGVAWRKYRGKRVIECPENHMPAGVSLDVRHAAATALQGETRLRLRECSRWPERQDCGQDCLFQIERAPADCLVRNILVRWYEGKDCAWCGRPIGEIHVVDRKPALLVADQGSLEWNQVPAEQLSQILAVAQPLCFTCHVANTMIRQHPELVIDRSRTAVLQKR